MEMVLASNTPITPTVQKNEHKKEAIIRKVPLTQDGAVPHVALDDYSFYVRWLFDHPKRSSGMGLSVAIDYIRYANLASARRSLAEHLPSSTSV
jgi:hypothetical protein